VHQKFEKSNIGVYVNINNKPQEVLSINDTSSSFYIPHVRMRENIQLIAQGKSGSKKKVVRRLYLIVLRAQSASRKDYYSRRPRRKSRHSGSLCSIN